MSVAGVTCQLRQVLPTRIVGRTITAVLKLHGLMNSQESQEQITNPTNPETALAKTTQPDPSAVPTTAEPEEKPLTDTERRQTMRDMGMDKRAIRRLMAGAGKGAMMKRQVACAVMTVYYANTLESCDRFRKWIVKSLNNPALADTVKLAAGSQLAPLALAQAKIGKEFLIAADASKPSQDEDGGSTPKQPGTQINQFFTGLPPVAKNTNRAQVPAISGDEVRDA